MKALREVRRSPPPDFGKQGRVRGKKAAGKTYEKRVFAELEALRAEGKLRGELLISPWFYFEDWGGRGFAQPDAILVQPHRVVIFEAKLRCNSTAHDQLNLLYGPLCERFFGRPWVGVQVYKFPAPRRGVSLCPTVEAPQEIEPKATSGIYHWHFLG